MFTVVGLLANCELYVNIFIFLGLPKWRDSTIVRSATYYTDALYRNRLYKIIKGLFNANKIHYCLSSVYESTVVQHQTSIGSMYRVHLKNNSLCRDHFNQNFGSVLV